MHEQRLPPSHPASRGGIRAARSSDGLVFLDVEKDSYFCIYDPQTGGEPRDPSAVSALLAAQGVALDATTCARLASSGTTAWQDMPDGETPALALIDIYRFGLALARAGVAFRRCSFAQLLDRPSVWPAVHWPDDHAVLTTTVRRFERLALWLPFRMQCLFRSVCLLEFLRAYGLRADWIFGATLFPFNAHCWLAAGDMLLGEHSSRVDRLSVLRVIAAAGR